MSIVPLYVSVKQNANTSWLKKGEEGRQQERSRDRGDFMDWKRILKDSYLIFTLMEATSMCIYSVYTNQFWFSIEEFDLVVNYAHKITLFYNLSSDDSILYTAMLLFRLY